MNSKAETNPIPQNLEGYYRVKYKDLYEGLEEVWKKYFPEDLEEEKQKILQDIAKTILQITSGNLELGDDKRALLGIIEDIFRLLKKGNTKDIHEKVNYLKDILLMNEEERVRLVTKLTNDVGDYNREILNRHELDKKRCELKSLASTSGIHVSPREELIKLIEQIIKYDTVR